jgi:putative ABC transport system ATP-binding protein
MAFPIQSLTCRQVGLNHTAADGSEKRILREVSLEAKSGEISLVTGAVGAGKSSLLHILAGLQRPTTGVVMADGQPVSRWTGAFRDRWRRQLGIVMQHPQLLRDLTVLENVMLPMVPGAPSLSAIRRRALQRLEELQIESLAGESVRFLSGGELQRVSLARALAPEPGVLIADEPTAHQDENGAGLVTALLERVKKKPGIVILACHDDRRQRWSPLVDRHFRLRNGRLVQLP